eukprot:COSAG03_NODE_8_length_24035_cov_36.331885_21_plen_202_part_00
MPNICLHSMVTGGIRPYAPCHGRHTRALVLGHTCAIQCNLKWAYVYHGPRGAYMLMNTLSMVLRRFPNPFRRHSLYNTATRAAPCSSQRATTPIHTPLNQRRIELETRHRTRIRAPPSSAFLLKISKCPTHFARASRRATTRCLRRVTMRYHLTYSNTFCCYAWLCRLGIHCAHVVGLVRGQFRWHWVTNLLCTQRMDAAM